MLEYILYQKKQQFKTKGKRIEFEQMSHIEKGTLNCTNLMSSKANKYLFDIPERNQKQLNKTGITTFRIVKTTVVTIRRKP